MRKLLYTFIFAIALHMGTHAQVKLIGVANNTSTSNIEVIQWALFDSSSVTATPTSLDAYLFASSAFDPFNGNYYISGVSGPTTGLYTFNSESGESSLTTGSLNTNTAEFDMSTSKMYSLSVETPEYISVYEYDIATNENSLVGTIYEPGAIGIVVDAIGFDSNNGILYYVGFTNDPGLALYAIPVRDESFSFTRTILTMTSAFGNITSLNFDNVNERLFAANDTYDENGNSTGRNIVEIDITTGDLITLGQLSEFPYFVGGSSLFDQNTGTFLLVGISNTNTVEMIAFDTNTNTYISGFVPDNVSEIACDNTLFARSTYALAGMEQQVVLDLQVYPNPVNDVLTIACQAQEPLRLQIISSLGELVYERSNLVVDQLNVDLSFLSTGLYTVNLTGSQRSESRKILVK